MFAMVRQAIFVNLCIAIIHEEVEFHTVSNLKFSLAPQIFIVLSALVN